MSIILPIMADLISALLVGVGVGTIVALFWAREPFMSDFRLSSSVYACAFFLGAIAIQQVWV